MVELRLPTGEHWEMAYGAEPVQGLLQAITEPRAGDDVNLDAKSFTYDADGLLTGTTTLTRETFESATFTVAGQPVELGPGFRVTKQTGPETRTFVTARPDPDEVQRRVLVDTVETGNGLAEIHTLVEDSPQETRVLSPDGTEHLTTREPHAVWAALLQQTASTEVRVPWPDGSTRSAKGLTTRTVTGADPDKPWKLASDEREVVLFDPTAQDPADMPTWRFTTDYTAGTITLASPERRRAVVTLETWPPGCGAVGDPACGGTRVSRVQTGGLRPTCYHYDDANGQHWRLVAVDGACDGALPGPGDLQLDFDAAERWSSVVAADGAARVRTDVSGRVVAVESFADGGFVDPPLATVSLAYDVAGALASLTTPTAEVHTFAHRLAESTYTPPPAGGVPEDDEPVVHAFDAYGRLLGSRLPGGAAVAPALDVEVQYDAAGRPSGMVFPGWAHESTPDELGRLATLVRRPAGDPGATVELSWERAGALVVAERVAVHDGNGQVEWSARLESRFEDPARPLRASGLRVTSFDGAQVHAELDVTIDRDGLPTAVQVGGGALTIDRDSAVNHGTGAVTGTAQGVVTTERTYTELGELQSETTKVNGAVVFQRDYTYDDARRVSTVTELAEGAQTTYTYAYDEQGRLASVHLDDIESETYTYDANGNRLTANGAASTYDAQDRLLTAADGAVTYEHNPLGQRTRRVEGPDTTDYTYDALGNLLRIDHNGAPLAEYRVDAKGRRVELHGQLQWRYALYQDALDPVAEFDEAGNLVSRFVYATRPHVPDLILRDGAVYRVITDHLGSVRLVINTADGTVAQRRTYDAWGNLLTDETLVPDFDQPFGFAGGLHDPATGLVRFGARGYDPKTARWTARDPILFAAGDPNLYAYRPRFLQPHRLVRRDQVLGLEHRGPGIGQSERRPQLTALDRGRIFRLERGVDPPRVRARGSCEGFNE